MIDYTAMYPIVLSAMRGIRGECTEHTNRRITKANCDICVSLAVVDALRESRDE